MIGVGIVLGLLFALGGKPVEGLLVAVFWSLAFPEAWTIRWPRRQRPKRRPRRPDGWGEG